jgi:hypothetical protein
MTSPKFMLCRHGTSETLTLERVLDKLGFLHWHKHTEENKNINE